MIDLISEHRGQIEALCQRFHVKRLSLFGSAKRGDFDPKSSDLDFTVEFASTGAFDRSDAYFGMLFGLEDLFKKRIDLLEYPAIRNPYLLKAIDGEREPLYEAA